MLKSFSLTVSSDGSVTAGIDVDAVEGIADSGNLGDDLTDLLVALGEAAQERDTGVAFLVDEVQFLQRGRVRGADRGAAPHGAAAAADHARRRGPAAAAAARGRGEVVRGAALQVPAHRPALRRRRPRRRSREPAAELGVTFEPGAIDVIVDYTEGYPYFVQEYGKIVWDMAPEGRADQPSASPREAQRAVEAKLDESFFRVRAERTTELELQLPARRWPSSGRASTPPATSPPSSGRTSEQLGPTRARLIDKGLIYTTGHGRGDFTVPQFDRYLRRNYEL